MPTRARIDPAYVAILAGVCAALHVGKLAPAIPALQAALGISLVQAGFLLSMVQVAGMSLGLAFGVLADGLGARRSMLTGLLLLAAASAAGAAASSAPALMVLRACEGMGFLLVVLAAPTLLRRLVAPARLNLVLGMWSAYMPLATALALLAGPLVVAGLGWAAWWAALAVVSAAMAVWLAWAVLATADAALASTATAAAPPRLLTRLRRTLAARGPWLLAGTFAVYAAQWLAVIGFLPTIYAQAGASAALTGVLTAAVAAANIVGNVLAGRLLHEGAAPGRLLTTGFAAMALCAWLAFGAWPGGSEPLLPAAGRYVAVLLLSGIGGLIPSTLFTLAVPATPREGSLASTVGWMQQGAALGQFAGPPLAAWVAARAGGWHLTWVATGLCALAGLALSAVIARTVGQQRVPASAGA